MKTLLTLLAFLCLSSLYAQPQWDWAKYGTGGASPGETPTGNSVCVDAMHNVYVTGTYSYIFHTGADTLVSGNSGTTMFIAKYDVNGNLQWLKQAQSNLLSEGVTVNADEQGCVYVCGIYRDSIQFDSIKLIDTIGSIGVFVVKYTPGGNIIWAKSIESAGTTTIGANIGTTSMILDKLGHLYIAGNFASPALITPTLYLDNITLPSAYNSNLFLAKYDTSGHVIWAKGAGGGIFSFGLASDSIGNVFVSGSFDGDTAHFDSVKLIMHVHPNGFDDMFLAKYDSSGKVLWAKDAGGKQETLGVSVVTDKAGNVIVAGLINSDTTTFDNVHLYLPSYLNDNGFLAKYTAAGSLVWVKNIGINTAAENYLNGMVIDAHDYLFMTGIFEDTSYLMNDTITSKGGGDIFVASFDNNGNARWLTTAGGTQNDQPHSIAIDPSGPVYVTGFFQDTCTFGSSILGGSDQNMFVAKLLPNADAVKQVNLPGSNISVYPNPASNSITIDFGTAAFTNLKVMDYTGRNILTQSVTGKQTVTLSIGSMASGLYLITAESNNGSLVSRKIIVQH